MQKSDLQLLFAYNTWANRKILAASAGVPIDQFVSPIGYSWGSLQAILVHTLTAELVWRTRLQGKDATSAFLDAKDFASPAALIEFWSVEAGLLDEYLASLEDADLQKTIQYKTRRGQPMEDCVWQVLLHVVNHGTQHRSEAAQILTSLGHSPGDIDLIVFLRE
jgi:uncharacterized damage-inducible protein DinB